MTEPTREQPVVSPEVTTRSPWHVSRIPAHLGRARTSTVVLTVLFLAIFALYLNIRPDTTGTATGGTSSQLPAATTAPVPQTTTPAPTPETTHDQPTTTEAPTSTAAPTDMTTPEPSTDSTPTTTATTGLSTPTVSSPAG
jgi:hypothetical protein